MRDTRARGRGQCVGPCVTKLSTSSVVKSSRGAGRGGLCIGIHLTTAVEHWQPHAMRGMDKQEPRRGDAIEMRWITKPMIEDDLMRISWECMCIGRVRGVGSGQRHYSPLLRLRGYQQHPLTA